MDVSAASCREKPLSPPRRGFPAPPKSENGRFWPLLALRRTKTQRRRTNQGAADTGGGAAAPRPCPHGRFWLAGRFWPERGVGTPGTTGIRRTRGARRDRRAGAGSGGHPPGGAGSHVHVYLSAGKRRLRAATPRD